MSEETKLTLEFKRADTLRFLLLAEGFRVADILGKTGANRLADILENPTGANLDKLKKIQQWIGWALEYYEVEDDNETSQH